MSGARYRRVGERWPVYRVVRTIEFQHHPAHVVMVAENDERRTITIGKGELFDRHQWDEVD